MLAQAQESLSLFDVLQNAVELVEAVVVDNQFARAFRAVLNASPWRPAFLKLQFRDVEYRHFVRDGFLDLILPPPSSPSDELFRFHELTVLCLTTFVPHANAAMHWKSP